MARVALDITISLDGFVAGPSPTVEKPLGDGGELLHEWIFGLASWRARHGLDGGTRGADDDVYEESVAATGAVVMGRRMFSGGGGAWEDDPVADGWWGDDPPFGVPVFVVTHHAREPLVLGATTFTFVTAGVEEAVDRARAAAGDRNVAIAGGASVVQQAIRAGLLDELQLHVAPVLLGGGLRLFDDVGPAPQDLELTRATGSAAITHLRYRVR